MPAIRDDGASTEQPACDSMEDRVLAIWADVLGLHKSQINPNNNFMQIGGDSILAIRLNSLMHQAGMNVSARDIIMGKTLHEMSKDMSPSSEPSVFISKTPERFSMIPQTCDQHKFLEDVATRCKVSLDEIEDIYPGSQIHALFVFGAHQYPTRWTMQGVVDLPPEVDRKRLKEAWQKNCADNAILRSRTVDMGYVGPFMVVLRDYFEWIEVEGDEFGPDVLLEQKMKMAPGGPQIIFMVSRTKFCITIHHNLFDFWSLAFTMGDAQDLYSTGTATKREPFSKFIKFLQGVDHQKSRAYWVERLKDCRPTTFPPNLPPQEQIRANQVIDFQLKWKKNAKSNATKSVLLTAAWGLTVNAFSGEKANDVIFASILSGRMVPVGGVEDMNGPCLTMHPKRMRWNPAQTVNDLINELQDDAANTEVYEHIGYWRMCALGEEGLRALTAQSSALIIYPPDMDSKYNDLTKKMVDKMGQDGDIDRTSVSITLQVGLNKEGARIWIFYDPKIYPRTLINEILGHVEEACEIMGNEEISMPISELMERCWKGRHDWSGRSLPSRPMESTYRDSDI